MQYFRTSCGDKLHLAKSWFRSHIASLFNLKKVPKRKDPLQTFIFDNTLKAKANKFPTNGSTGRREKAPAAGVPCHVKRDKRSHVPRNS